VTKLVESVRFPALGTTCVVLASEASSLSAAREIVEGVIGAVDRACSRFRADSDITRVNEQPGRDVEVSGWLIDALEVALRGAKLTGGLIDPTVGSAMRVIGYDRDFADVAQGGPPLTVRVRAVPGWQRVQVNRARGTVRVENSVELDLGATAKAWCADRAANLAALETDAGVVVGLGGDIACDGPSPAGGWLVRVAENHAAPLDDPDGQIVSIVRGGIATSGTSVRRWARGDREFHHIVDPATGLPAPEHWQTVSVAAATCADANIASTAAVILGAGAPAWLSERGLSARLTAADGSVTTTCAWPA
jgi:thiamine biosynthesis lipoprotein